MCCHGNIQCTNRDTCLQHSHVRMAHWTVNACNLELTLRTCTKKFTTYCVCVRSEVCKCEVRKCEE